MASVSHDGGGKRRIQFVSPEGKRKAIHLGKISQTGASTICVHVEHLLASKRSGLAVEAKTATWIADVPKWLAKKLVKAGLIDMPEAKDSATLEAFLLTFIEGRADLKQSSIVVYSHTQRNLNDFLGSGRDVSTITPGEADDFKQWLITQKLAPSTIHKRLQVARQFFHAMRRRRLIAENPFDGVTMPATALKGRQRFVTREETQKLLDACPNADWRAIVALARYGGLRCPSEVLSLRWQDINWATGRIVVTSPKTEHHAGKESRVIPLFPELRTELVDCQYLAPEKAEYVVDPKYRKAAMSEAGWLNANLRTTFTKIIKRAGLAPWPRPFHNLRASRETELVERYPVQVVTQWLGNTPTVAMKHYLMTTDEHFAAAVADEADVAQKTAQQPHGMPSNSSHTSRLAHKESPAKQGSAGECGVVLTPSVDVAGLEPATPAM